MVTRPSRIILFMAMSIIGMFMLVACGNGTPRLAQPSPAGHANQPPTAVPAEPTQLPKPLTALNGLYVGRNRDSDIAVAYLFKPSGTVAHDFYQSVVDPDEAAGWPTIEVYVETEAKGYEPYRVSLGTYQLLGDRIRLNTHELYVDATRKVNFRETAFGDPIDQNEELSFRTLPDLSAISIDGVVLVRQGDLTGTKLSGDFAQDGQATIRASFTPNGEFSWSFSSTYNGPGATGGMTGVTVTGSGEEVTGQYQVQGNEIILRYSDGRVDEKVFADLGRESGREVLAIGGWILEER